MRNSGDHLLFGSIPSQFPAERYGPPAFPLLPALIAIGHGKSETDIRRSEIAISLPTFAQGSGQKSPEQARKKGSGLQTANLKRAQAMMSMMAENLRPAVARPSPICPATRPEKKPMTIAAWEKILL
jgi:hypothetical protein